MKDYEKLKVLFVAVFILMLMSMFLNLVQRIEINNMYQELFNNQIEYKRVLGLWNNCEKESIELIKRNYDCSTREIARYTRFFERLYKLDQERRKNRSLINYKSIKGGK